MNTSTGKSIDQVGPDEGTVEQLKYLLIQMADLATSTRCLATTIISDGGREFNVAAAVAIQCMGAQMGYLIELGEQKLGSNSKADAVGFMTSPAYCELESVGVH